MILKSFLALLICLAGFSQPAISDGIRWIWIVDHYECLLGNQIFEMDPTRGTWSPHREGWPPLNQVRSVYSNHLWWDGFEACAAIYPEEGRPRVLSFTPERGRIPAWYPRMPVELEKGERVLACYQGKALIRKDVYQRTDVFAPANAIRGHSRAGTQLLVVDLVDGRRTDIEFIRGNPYDMEINSTLHNGDIFVFSNEGKAWKIKGYGFSVQLLTENFYQESNVNLADNKEWMSDQIWPNFKAFPFFSSTGEIILAMEGFLPDESISGSELKEKIEPTLGEKRKLELKRLGTYPFVEGRTYSAAARGAIFLSFDVGSKKWTQVDPERTVGLLEPSPQAKRPIKRFKDSGGAVPLLCNGRDQILRLDGTTYPRAIEGPRSDGSVPPTPPTKPRKTQLDPKTGGPIPSGQPVADAPVRTGASQPDHR